MMKKFACLIILFLAACNLYGAPGTRTILVFPFENQSVSSDLGWISEAFAEVLTWRLAGPNRYVLGREERNAAYEQLGLPLGLPLTLASTYKAAETLGVDWAVLGNFHVEGNRLTAHCQLLQMRGLKLTPALEATGALSDLVDLQTRLAWRLLATHDPEFIAGTEDDFAHQFPEIRLDAFENYIRGTLATDGESRVHFLSEANRLNPGDRRAAFELGRHYFGAKQYAESAKWLQKLGRADPNYLESLFFLGVDQYFLGQDAKAEEAFRTLEKEIPLGDVSNNLGLMEARRGQYKEALESLQRAYQVDPSDPDFCFNLGVCLWRLRAYDEAARYLQEGLRQDPNDSETHALLVRIYGKLGNLEEQRRELNWLAKQEGGSSSDSPENYSPEMRLKKSYNGHAFGLLAVVVRNTAEAKLAQEPVPQQAEAHINQGEKLLVAGRFPEAERELNEAISLAPQDHEAHLVLGQVYESEGKHREAADELQTSLSLDNNAMTQLWLARVYLSLNQPAEALEHGRAALSLDPGNGDAERLVEAIRKRSGAAQTTPKGFSD